MDTNLSIIQLVQRRPILYTRCDDFPRRANQWKEVADILKSDVSFVKSRWHLLRTRFMAEYSSVLKGNRTSFKYLNEMSFLSNHINLEAFEMYFKRDDQYRTEPEFNITKKDLEDDSDDDSASEFIELELDEEGHRELAQIPYSNPEEMNQNVYVEPIYIDDYSNTSEPQEQEDISSENEQKQQVELFIEVPASTPNSATPKPAKSPVKSEDDKSVVLKEDARVKIKNQTETQTSAHEIETICKSETKSSEEQPASVLENSTATSRTENSRCEDTIFGELVTATLRQMPTDKKRAVKREIMNLLFT